ADLSPPRLIMKGQSGDYKDPSRGARSGEGFSQRRKGAKEERETVRGRCRVTSPPRGAGAGGAPGRVAWAEGPGAAPAGPGPPRPGARGRAAPAPARVASASATTFSTTVTAARGRASRATLARIAARRAGSSSSRSTL